MIPSITVGAGGVIIGTSTNDITDDGVTMHSVYDVTGFFHGFDTNGNQRAAGEFTDTVTYTENGTNYTCTSGLVPWTATR